MTKYSNLKGTLLSSRCQAKENREDSPHPLLIIYLCGIILMKATHSSFLRYSSLLVKQKGKNPQLSTYELEKMSLACGPDKQDKERQLETINSFLMETFKVKAFQKCHSYQVDITSLQDSLCFFDHSSGQD